jgi:hypothetical protein
LVCGEPDSLLRFVLVATTFGAAEDTLWLESKGQRGECRLLRRGKVKRMRRQGRRMGQIIHLFISCLK